MPKVSIGLPVYNGERFLEKVLDGLLAQSFQDFEIIICDNASSDGTPAICSAYAELDERVRFIRNPRNIGAAPNFNKTFQQARGEYFAWAAHDDVHHPGFLEACVAVLDKDRDAVLVHTLVDIVDDGGSRLRTSRSGDRVVLPDGQSIRRYDRAHIAEASRPDVRFRQVLHEVFWCFQLFGMIRTEALRHTRLRRSYHGANKVLLADLALMGRFVQIEKHLYARRADRLLASYTKLKRQRDWIDPNGPGGLPMVHRLRDYSRAILKSPLPLSQRIYCFASFARKVERCAKLTRALVPGPDNVFGINLRKSAPRSS